MHIPDYIIIITGIVMIGIIVGFYIYLSKNRRLESYAHLMSPCRMADYSEAIEKPSFTKSLINDDHPCADPTLEPDRFPFRPSHTLEWLVNFINMRIRGVRGDTTLYVCNVPQLFDPTWLSVNENLPHRAEMFISLEQEDAAGRTIRRKRLATISVQDTSLISCSTRNVASCEEWLERFIADGSATGLDNLLEHLGDGDVWFDKWAGEFEAAAQEYNSKKTT